MSGALNSVFGGGGVGGLVGSALSTAIGVAFPPAAIASSLASIVTQGLGPAIGAAMDSLTAVAGMPKFIADEVKQLAGSVIDRLTQQSDPHCDDQVRHHCGGAIQDLLHGVFDSICKDAVDNMKESGGGKGGGSWYEALAKALGSALDKQAGKIEELSKKVEGMKDSSESDKASTMTDLQAASQKMSFMMNAASDTLKTIGQALGTMASKN